jgi:hypothetical protein
VSVSSETVEGGSSQSSPEPSQSTEVTVTDDGVVSSNINVTFSSSNVVVSCDGILGSMDSVDVCGSNSTVTFETSRVLGWSVLVEATVVIVVSGVSVIAGTSVGFVEETDGHSTKMHGKVSSDSPVHLPPFLAGITTALSLFLNESPQVAEHFPQSLHTDHKQSEGRIDTIMDDSVEVN